MHRHRDGQELSPEALRQLGTAFAAAGAGFDPGLAMAAWKLLSSADRARAQIGDPSVLGTLQRAAEEQVKIAKQTQAQAGGNIHGAKSDAAAQGFHLEHPRGRSGGLWDQLAGRASSERGSASGSSERYAEAGMSASVSGNADLRGVTMANYYTSPITRAMVDTGMNYGTFNYLRDQGFTSNNIASAAHDARALGFSTNDQRMVKNHATIQQKGNNPVKTNQLFQKFQKGLRGDEAFRDAALAWHKAKPEDKDAAWKNIEALSKQQAKKIHIPEHMAQQRDEAVRNAIGEVIKDITKKEVDEAIKQAPEAQLKTDAGKTTLPLPNATNAFDAAEAAIKAKLVASGVQPATDAASHAGPAASKPAGAPPQPTSTSTKPANPVAQPAASIAKPGGTAP